MAGSPCASAPVTTNLQRGKRINFFPHMGNPLLGVLLHWLGGLASGSFYVPYKGVKKWSWETYWLVGGFFSWIICPSLFAYFMTNDLAGVIRQQSAGTLWWTYFFGVLWGF